VCSRPPPASHSPTASTTPAAGTVGVGLEYGFAPNWSAGIEYNHLFMQDKTYNREQRRRHRAGLLVAQSRIRQDVDLVTARINYKFSGY
jgi:outer membrane immunogenic protein